MAKLSPATHRLIKNENLIYSYVRGELGFIKGVVVGEPTGGIGYALLNKKETNLWRIDIRTISPRFLSSGERAMCNIWESMKEEAFPGNSKDYFLRTVYPYKKFNLDKGIQLAAIRALTIAKTSIPEEGVEFPNDKELLAEVSKMIKRIDAYYKK